MSSESEDDDGCNVSVMSDEFSDSKVISSMAEENVVGDSHVLNESLQNSRHS